MTWQFDEAKAAGPEHLAAEHVTAYDRKARFDPTSELQLLQALGLSSTSEVLDLGAGTGEFALAAAKMCRRVVAVDISQTMLKVLHRKALQALATNLEVVNSGLLQFVPDGDFDFVYCRNTLHHLPDFWKVQALGRMHAALRPGGVLRLRDLAFSFEPQESGVRIEAWLTQAEQQPGGFPRAELEAHVRGEFSTFTWLLEPMLVRTGFALESVVYSPSGIFAAYVCRRL
ncbi:class I SAM-dependent methyltransferase [Deinococcus hopiensis]|uniref:Ubiquinone/menaquinone biosynthesis C-methylase UbiE n=1 Tax=Deinococcus hopiensis KR-140 TaxID=695939 RepID=A0A1W1UQ15_9DEIO|nr:class I SAM-dependent methyltransferase [Deinococcus hopiensis]SMB82794.1 Ubiquinone/menaquinone biosynthesis C-methylase UbiE [Deinococcus hopiensis KR-140]